jgi:alanine dehydrogenase
MTKFFTIKRLKVAWKIIRPALGVLTIAAPGSREAKIAAVVIGLVAKNAKKGNKLTVRYQQALVALARLEQLTKMYKQEIEATRKAEDKLLAAVQGPMTTEAPDADGTGKEV